jgi:hypothetical protein
MHSIYNIILFISFGIFSISSNAMDAPKSGPLTIICEPSASPKYTAFVDECMRNGKYPSAKLIQFARDGERSAIRTVMERLPPNLKEELLRDLVRNNVKAAIPILGRVLHDRGSPECLQWYDQSGDVHKIDPDFRSNYAHALLLLQKDKQAVDKAWELLVAWEKEDMLDNEEDKIALYGGYTLLFRTAKELNYGDFAIRFADSLRRQPVRYMVRDSFIATFEGTPFINLIAKHAELLPVRVSIEELLQKGHLPKIIKAVLDRNKEYDNNVTSIVVGNLSALLQDKDVMQIPGKIIPNFDNANPTKGHLTIWAREIINTRRDKLIRYDGKDIMLKTQFAQLSNYMLEQMVVAAFQEIFYLQDESAAKP